MNAFSVHIYMCLELTIYNWIAYREAGYMSLEKMDSSLLKAIIGYRSPSICKPCKITPSTLAHIDVAVAQFLFGQPCS